MTRRVGIVMSAAALSVMVSSVAFGQPPAGAPPAGGRGGRGGGRGGPAYVSPEVSADGNITVRLFAPNAQQVTASGELDGKPHPMTKGEDGIWSVTVGPLPPDIYTYSFNVDGLTVLDPRKTNTKMGSAGQNMDQTYASFSRTRLSQTNSSRCSGWRSERTTRSSGRGQGVRRAIDGEGRETLVQTHRGKARVDRLASVPQ